MVRDTHRKTAGQFEQFRGAQVPDTLRVFAETDVAQTRALYERSKDTLQTVLESWQKSFGAAGQGAVALQGLYEEPKATSLRAILALGYLRHPHPTIPLSQPRHNGLQICGRLAHFNEMS
jgi:hypothetical protein